MDFLRGNVALLLLGALVACASGSKVVDHAFTFDLFADSPDAELLAYRYGDSNLPVSWMPGPTEKSKAPQRSNVNGPMRQGDSLYVKWRLKSSGTIYEDTVDLRNRLPKDMTNHRIYFMIKGPQLFVYVIPPLERPSGSNTPRMYPDANATRIYPDPQKM
jgi:hypothetical protein